MKFTKELLRVKAFARLVKAGETETKLVAVPSGGTRDVLVHTKFEVFCGEMRVLPDVNHWMRIAVPPEAELYSRHPVTSLRVKAITWIATPFGEHDVELTLEQQPGGDK